MRKFFVVFEEDKYGYSALATFTDRNVAEEYAQRERDLISKEENRKTHIEVYDWPVFDSIEEADIVEYEYNLE